MHSEPEVLDLGPAVEAYQAAADKRAFLEAQGPCGAALIAAAIVIPHVLRQMIDEDGGGAVFAELHRQREVEATDG